MNDRGLKLLKHYESCRLTAYQDGGGVWTIGWGHTKGVKKGDVCSQEQADKWLVEEVGYFEYNLSKVIRISLNEDEFAAVTCLTYNIGINAFLKSTLLKKLNVGDRVGAAGEFIKWDKDNGKVVMGLLYRRMDERDLFLSVPFVRYHNEQT